MSDGAKRRPRVFCDLHGVLVDFVTPACAAMGVRCEPEKFTTFHWYRDVCGFSDDEFWDALADAGTEFWATLPDYPWTFELLALLHELDKDWSIITAPGRDPCTGTSVDGTRELIGPLRRSWRPHRSIIHSSDKARSCTPGDILIDDSCDNVDAWREAGGHGVLWPRPWNQAGKERESDEQLTAYLWSLGCELRQHIEAANDGA